MGERAIIGIVPSQRPEEQCCCVRDHYVDAIVAAGGAPLIVPLTSDIATYERLFPLMDGFVLTGGQDIDAARYGEDYEPDVERIRRIYPTIQHGISQACPTREEVECLVLSYAYRFDVPVLGICRGMQMMNVYFGGTLYTDLADQFGAEGAGEGAAHWQQADYATPAHFVNVVRASRLGEVLQADRVPTNSMHHQGVRSVAPLLDPTAYGPDGLVEAVEVRDRTFMMGVQWHPEFFAGDKHMGCLFSSLVRHAEGTRERRGSEEATLAVGSRCEACPRCPAIPRMLSITRADAG